MRPFESAECATVCRAVGYSHPNAGAELTTDFGSFGVYDAKLRAYLASDCESDGGSCVFAVRGAERSA